MPRLLIPALLVSLSVPTGEVAADNFYFGTAEAAERMEGSPDVIEGVLLREEDGVYVIRIEGGEIMIPKSKVHRIEKTGLTVEDLEQREADSKEQRAAANVSRRQMQAVEAAVARDAAVAEAAAEREAAPQVQEIIIEVDFAGLLPNYQFKPTYDPVLHRVNLEGIRRAVEAYLSGEVRRAAHRH